MSNALFDLGEISGETIFIDGTKIEASANKYTFVWKKAVTKNQTKLLIKLAGFVAECEQLYELKSLLSWAIPKQLFGLFTSNPETIQIGVSALHTISLGFLVSAVSVTSSGALEGLGKGTPALIISLLRYVVVIIPAAFCFSRFVGADGVWGAFCFSEFVTAGCSLLIYRRAAEE